MKVDEKILLSIMEFIKTTKALKEMKNFFQRPFCFPGENVQVDQVNMFCASYVEEEETNMKKNLLGKMMITGIISAAMLASTAASTWAADKSDEDVLQSRYGMCICTV